MNIKIYNGQEYLPDNFFLFPAGEVGIKLNAQNYQFFQAEKFTICAQVQNSNDIIRIGMVKDAIRKIVGYKKDIELFLPYFPYARQDRLCDKGEAFSLSVFARHLKHLNFDLITVVDPHSNGVETVLDVLEIPYKIITQFDIFHAWQDLKKKAMGLTFVAPDAGSNKKTFELASYLNHKDFIRADKLRDTTNGKIKEIKVYCDDLNGQDVIVADDIAEKCGTFLGLAAELKKKNVGKIILYVTHGIFSHEKSVNIVLENGFDEVFMTNSYHNKPMGYYPENKVHILDLNKTFLK